MNAKQLASLALAALIAALASACSPDIPKADMLAVNEENCKPEGIGKIKDNSMREQFQNMCVRRNTFKASPKKAW